MWYIITISVVVVLGIVIIISLYVRNREHNQSISSEDNSSFGPGKCGRCGETTESVSGEESRSYGKSAGCYTMEYFCKRCPKCGWESDRTYYGGYWDHA